MNIEGCIIGLAILVYIAISLYERYLLKELKRKISRTEKLVDECIAVNGAIICELDEQKDAIRLREIRNFISDLKYIRNKLI